MHSLCPSLPLHLWRHERTPMAPAPLSQVESALRALLAELKRSDGFASWLTGTAQHGDVRTAADAAIAALHVGASATDAVAIADSAVRAEKARGIGRCAR